MRRQVGDEEGEQPEAESGLGERQARRRAGSLGRTKPSVKSDDPLSVNAARQLATPTAWNISMNPTSTIDSQTTGRSSKVNGAYSAMTRSRPS